jgi:SAM-dependent methyltransferase
MTRTSDGKSTRRDELEILSASLLDEHRGTVDRLRKYARRLHIGLGWHYLLDLSWILDRLEVPRGSVVLDAGAGQGVLQWYLCERGHTVLSVDRASRALLPVRFRARFRVRGLREGDLESLPATVIDELRHDGVSWRAPARQIYNLAEFVRRPRATGEIVVHNTDLRSLGHVPDASVDAVVAVSALEHNPPSDLASVIDELMRVIKPGGALIATLGAARDADWYHEPSRGWCYTERSLRRLFELDTGVASNYARYDELMAGLTSCAELRDNLADFYFWSADNGMPWGRWDPQYQPVGVVRVKRVLGEDL